MGNDSLHASLYQPGLDENNEAVISAHFMDKINANTLLNLYGSEQFYARAFYVSSSWVIENLLPALEKASDHFVSERVSAARKRAIRNYKEYGRHNPKDIDTAEFITEVMFDRQFLKGRKGNCSRMALAKRVKESLENKLPIRMVIPALPYKSTSPLKSRGILPDLSEVNFLLGLAEVAKTISRIYCEDNPAPNSFAKFIVISDGSRFNRFLNEPIENIQAYQQQLNWWINTLNIADYVEIVDYQDVIGNLLPKDQYLQKNAIRNEVLQLYTDLMLPLLNPCAMSKTMIDAIACDPDPETDYAEGRFVPLFKSLVYTISYQCLHDYASILQTDYNPLYMEIIRHIFIPCTLLESADIAQVKAFIANPRLEPPQWVQMKEYFRQQMLKEAWRAAIYYIAEIRSDRELANDPILTCFPDAIRWTIHSKRGQLALLTTSGKGDPVQPWHGAALCQLTGTNRIKFYTHPALLLEGSGATPVLIKERTNVFGLDNQPLFYVGSDIVFQNSDGLLCQIEHLLTRKRKL